VLNVSFGAGMLGWALFTPVGFLLDPLFDSLGRQLLTDTASLRPLWTEWDNTALVPYTSFNNTVVLGSIVGWLVLFLPIALVARAGVIHYRATLAARLHRTRIYQTISASRLYNVYTWLRS
jgi:uncharacterized protein (TIGR03546 family)